MAPLSRLRTLPASSPLPPMLNRRLVAALATAFLAVAGCFNEPSPAYKTVDPALRVYLSDRGLVELPEINPKADYLNLDRNELESVDNISSLTELKWLRLNDNRLSALPDLSNLKKLRRIYLRGNRFKEVPRTLESLTSLTDIDLSSNPISEVPEWLAAKKGLLHLSFSNTLITSLPEDLSAWRSLKSLQLGDLRLSREEMARIRKALENVAIVF